MTCDCVTCDFLHGSCFSRRMVMCRRKICYALAGFYLLYLVMILLMRSGDVETNPGPNTLESTISEIEFQKLVQDIHPSDYMAVGISLGLSRTQLVQILIEKLNNYTNALLDVFMKWNAKQQPPNKNKREVLADALLENDLGDLSQRLRYGRLMKKYEGTITTDEGESAAQYELLTDTPADLILQDDETVISCGIRFSPSGAKLTTPFKVTLDHNAHFTNPRQAEIVLYTRINGMKNFLRIPGSTEGYPRCDVRTKDLDLYVDHFSDWWIVALLKRYFGGKWVNCIPYVERPIRKGLTHSVLLCIYDDLSNVSWKVEAAMSEYQRLHPPRPFFVAWRSGDVTVTLFECKNEHPHEVKVGEMRISERKFYEISFDVQTFWLTSSEREVKERFLKFVLYQGPSNHSQTVICSTLRYEETDGALPLAAPPPSPSLLPSPMSPLPTPVSLTTHCDLETEVKLENLAEHMPFGEYFKLCNGLGIFYNESQTILQRNQTDYRIAIRECLAIWKTRTGGSLEDLKKILVAMELRALLRFLGGPSRRPESQIKPPDESGTKLLSPEFIEHSQDDETQSPQNESDSDLESRVFSELSVPPEILARGPEAIRAYALALEIGKKKVFRTRLMLVGQEGVGKTSLKKSLTGQRFDPKEKLTDGAETEDICEINIEHTIDAETEDVCGISIEHIELHKDDNTSWSVKQKGNADDSVGEFKRVVVDHMVSTLRDNTSKDNASSEASLEPDTNESDDRHQGEAGAHGEKIPDGVTEDTATASQFDSKETTDTRMYGDKTVEAESTAFPPLKDERSTMEATEAPKASEVPEAPRETGEDEGLPDDVAELLEERLKVEGAQSGSDEGKDKASLNIWDFAGHDVYYTTHQVFLTWRAIYVIVCDLSTDLDSVVPPECRNRCYQRAKQGTKSELTCLEFIEFWLFSIYAHAVRPSPEYSDSTRKTDQKSPPIFIVGTHRDEVGKENEGDRQEKRKEKIAAAFDRIRAIIKGKPFECHVIPRYYQIENSLEGDKELGDLRKHIENVAKKEPYMGEEIPLRWLKFEEFHATNKKKGKNCITLDEVYIINVIVALSKYFNAFVTEDVFRMSV